MKNNDDATSSPKWTTSQHQTKNPGLIERPHLLHLTGQAITFCRAGGKSEGIVIIFR